MLLYRASIKPLQYYFYELTTHIHWYLQKRNMVWYVIATRFAAPIAH